MTDPKDISHETKFKRAVWQSALVYGKYMSKAEVDRYVTDLTTTVNGDWFLAVIALKSVINEYDVHPTVSDIFTSVLNINDDPTDKAWDLSSADEYEFYRIERPDRKHGRKRMPGGEK